MWLHEILNRPIEVIVRAHSGAKIVESEENVHQTDPNLNNEYPTLADQSCNVNNADDIDLILDPTLADQLHINNADDIDLILVSGGINDVGINNILFNPMMNANDIRRSAESIEESMMGVLTDLLGINEKCKIIVTGYYPIASQESNFDDLTKMGTILNAAINADLAAPSLKESYTDNSLAFYDSSMASLINAVKKSDSGTNRIFFAGVSFEPSRCYGTSESWLWKLVSTNPPRTDDELFDCRASFSSSNIVDAINSIGHPNVEGAREYNRSIVKKICSIWPTWLHPTVQAFDVSSRSLTSGESLEITYIVSDNGGSGLKQVELWRKDETSDWQEVQRNALSDETGPVSGSFTDSPPAPGKYWYGVHVVDNAGNWNDQKNSNTKGQPSSFEPVEVDIKSSEEEIQVASGAELQRLVHDGDVKSVSFSPDGSKVATACSDRTARIWDVASGAELQRLVHGEFVDSVSFNPDGSKVATASDDDTARIWDVASGEELQRLVHHHDVNSVSFSPDGSKVATASQDGTARIWDVASGEELQRLVHGGNVKSVSFSPDGSKVATACSDRTARIWDVSR